MLDDISISSLGFGCASVMGKIGEADSLRAMAIAYDLGITHFDVARSYGFGQAESILGKFIKGKRDKLTITSKYGVVPPNLGLIAKAVMPVARQLPKIIPNMKHRLHSKSTKMLADRRYDLPYAQECLERSLKELKTDYIDIYLIHEPQYNFLTNKEELILMMQEFIQSGKIRRWGYALHSPDERIWEEALDRSVIQFEGNISTLPVITPVINQSIQRLVTRPFGGGIHGRVAIQNVINNLGLEKFLTEINASIEDVALCLAHYLSGKNGTILCSMFSPNHIKNNVETLDNFSKNKGMTEIIERIVKYHSNALNSPPF